MLSLLRIHRQELRKEAYTTLKIGIPVIIAQLLQMSMAFVDTVMAGNLSARDLGAVAIGVSTALPFMILGLGMIMAISPIVAQLYGGRKLDEIGPNVRHSLILSQIMALPIFFLIRNLEPVMQFMEIDPEIMPLALAYIDAHSWGIPAMMAYNSLRFFNEGMGVSRPGMYIAFIGLLVNISGNYTLMYGSFGAPALGAVGCGYASAIVGWVMMIAMFLFTIRHTPYRRFRIFSEIHTPKLHYFKELVNIGVPLGITATMEVSMFALVSLLMGSIGTNAVAAHQIAINVASMTFMIPFGLSNAITARVGHAAGSDRMEDARFRGMTGIALAVLCMCITALLMFSFPEFIISIYTDDAAVQHIAVQLLFMAAVFQISDGLQVSGYGALRGLKDTKIPMYFNFISYWMIGFPMAYYLGFYQQMGPPGMWIGLIVGLTAAALLHNSRFLYLTSEG